MFVYDKNSVTRSIGFTKGRFHYLTIILSNCTLSGGVFVDPVATLEADIRTEFALITNLELRGIGCSMVRGDTDSLTLGISAGYYSTTANLTEANALALRTASVTAAGNVANLVVSEVRIESSLLQESTF